MSLELIENQVNTKINHKDIILDKSSTCSICNKSNLIEIMNMPSLPISGQFSTRKPVGILEGIDQSLLWCPECAHGQLSSRISPCILYDSQKYALRTSLSETSKEGTKVFLDYLKKLTFNKNFNCIFDVGCNDLYLLKEMKACSKIRVGLDPIWISNKPDNDDPDLFVIGGSIEDADLNKALPERPDLIICRHTLEHIFSVKMVLKKLIDFSTEDAIFLFEIPLFESLLTRGRFDQIFHEHLQYFSLSSFNILLEKCKVELIDYTENYQNWGTLMIAFKKGASKQKRFEFPFTIKEIEQRKNLFFSQMDNTIKILLDLTNTPIYGYGAALLLPVLAYHLKTDFSFLKAVIDDAEEKDGLFYANLPLEIQHSSKITKFNELAIFITAIDNVKPIMTKLFPYRPKHIIYPFHIM